MGEKRFGSVILASALFAWGCGPTGSGGTAGMSGGTAGASGTTGNGGSSPQGTGGSSTAGTGGSSTAGTGGGAAVFRDAAASCGAVRKWTSPIAVNGRIVVAADGKLCSWSPH